MGIKRTYATMTVDDDDKQLFLDLRGQHMPKRSVIDFFHHIVGEFLRTHCPECSSKLPVGRCSCKGKELL